MQLAQPLTTSDKTKDDNTEHPTTTSTTAAATRATDPRMQLTATPPASSVSPSLQCCHDHRLWEPHVPGVACELPCFAGLFHRLRFADLPASRVDEVGAGLHGRDQLLQRESDVRSRFSGSCWWRSGTDVGLRPYLSLKSEGFDALESECRTWRLESRFGFTASL